MFVSDFSGFTSHSLFQFGLKVLIHHTELVRNVQLKKFLLRDQTGATRRVNIRGAFPRPNKTTKDCSFKFNADLPFFSPLLPLCSGAVSTSRLRFFEYIYLYQSMVMFQIDQKTKQCSKVALTEAWDPFDIPDNSTFEDQYFIGGPGDNVEVQEWSDRKPARKRKSGSMSLPPEAMLQALPLCTGRIYKLILES